MKSKKTKEWLEGNIQMSSPQGGDWDDYISIVVECENSGTRFIDIKIKKENFASALFGRAGIPVEFKTRGLEKLGLHMIHETFEFEMPNGDYNGRRETAEKIVEDLCKGTVWTPDTGFNSQNSFFTKEGKPFARTIRRKYVTDKEYKAHLKAKGSFRL